MIGVKFRVAILSFLLTIVSLYYYSQGIDRSLIHIFNGIIFIICVCNLRVKELNFLLFGVIIILTLIYEIIVHVLLSQSPINQFNFIIILYYSTLLSVLYDAKKENILKVSVSIPFLITVTIFCILSCWSILQIVN